MLVSFKKIIQWLILLTIFCTPIYTFNEVAALLSGNLRSQTEVLTPIYIKALKDVSSIIIIVLAFAEIFYRQKISMYIYIYALILFFMVVVISRTLLVNPDLILSGIRWIIPFFLSFFLINFVDDKLMNNIAKILLLLFAIHFLLQIYQLFNMSSWYGENTFGLAARVPGIFLIPYTAAFFSILVLFFYQFYKKKNSHKILLHLLVVASVFLTMSGTGIVVYFIFLFMVLAGNKHIKFVLPLLPLVVVILILFLPFLIIGREENYLEISLGTRIQIFLDIIYNGPWLSNMFGAATNTAVLLRNTAGIESSAFIADSTYAAITANLGIIGLILFLLGFALWMIIVFKIDRLDLYVFTMIFSLFAITTIITEVFPANLIFAVCLAFYLSKYIRFSRRIIRPL